MLVKDIIRIMPNHLFTLTEPRLRQNLGDNGIKIKKMRVRKLLVKTPIADDSTHLVRLSIACYNQHIEIRDSGKTEYFFSLPVGGCENGYITYINNDTWDYISAHTKPEIYLHLHLTVDNNDVVLSEPAIIELEIV